MERLVCGGERCSCHKCSISDGFWCWMRSAFIALSAISVSVVRVWDAEFANDRFRAPPPQTRLSVQSPHSQGRLPDDLWNSCCKSCLPSEFIVVSLELSGTPLFPIIVFFPFPLTLSFTFCVKCIRRMFAAHNDMNKYSLQTTCWAIYLATEPNGLSAWTDTKVCCRLLSLLQTRWGEAGCILLLIIWWTSKH